MRAGAAIARIARHIDHGADRGELRHQKAMGLSGPYAAGIGKRRQRPKAAADPD